MKLQRNYLLLLVLAAALTLPGCYTQLQTTEYQDSSGNEMDYYAEQNSSYDAPRRSYSDLRLDYRNYQVADWYRDHYISPRISYNTYNHYNNFYTSPYYSSFWHDRYFGGFYHYPFYRPYRSGYGNYWSFNFSFGIGHGWYSYPTHGWAQWYGGYSPYGYYDRYSYYNYYGSKKVDQDHRSGPRGSGVQRTADRTRGDDAFINTRNNQGSGSTVRPTGSSQTNVNKGNTPNRTRSVDRDRNSRSRNQGNVNRDGSSGSSRSSGDRSRSSGRDGGRQTSSAQSSYDSYQEALRANTTARERAMMRYKRNHSNDQEHQKSENNNPENANYERDQNRANRSYTRHPQAVQFQFNNPNNRSSTTRSRSYMRSTSNTKRSHGTTNFNSQSSSSQRIHRSSSSNVSRSSGNSSRSSSSSNRSRSSGRDR